ncbi:MAG: hypothetical protein IJC55_04900 [Clostridia bacterium]|nr:hypothetical protein [Clostridia bacterium]
MLLMRLAVAIAETAMLLRAPQYTLARCIVIVLLDLFLLAPLTLGLARNVIRAEASHLMNWFVGVRRLFDAAITAAFFWLEQLLHAALWFSVLRICEYFVNGYASQWLLSTRWCVTVLWIFSSVGLLLRRLTAFVIASDADSCTVLRYFSVRRCLDVSWQQIGTLTLSALCLVASSLFLPLLPRNLILFLATLSPQSLQERPKNDRLTADLSQTQVFD